ncbi:MULTISPECIES: 2-amino-4-hydroxy-6-hydroxymethyldihydropteridine diphosphokinase [unclassified Agarivorans]|uniref:2-amino-4-hydroxy-6- hydroxymethyldihydropteridine diphosphokinase n=1 Tax=unclassified Agarivorans TaxID=2636026 RepID=UPI003D7E8D7B
MYYLCSLGSNIQPLQHIPQAVKQLCIRLHPITFSAFIQTAPSQLQSKHDFINGLAWFHSHQSAPTLKRFFNQLEDFHGRNRKDPLSSDKDRPLDIDLIGAAKQPQLLSLLHPDEFLIPLHQQLFGQNVELQQVVEFELCIDHQPGLPLGQGPTTINFDRTTGQIVVFNQ